MLIRVAQSKQNVIPIEPESLSLSYIANSTIIRFLNDLGVNLNPFYKLLWRHVFAITLLQHRYDIRDEQTAKASFLSRFFEPVEAKKQRQAEQDRRKKALAYLERWGGSFWKDIDVRTREITSTFETEVKNRLEGSTDLTTGAEFGLVKLTVGGKSGSAAEDINRLSEEKRLEIVHRAQEVVNEIQVKELTGMLDFLEEALSGSSNEYYIVIDRLDEGWIDDTLRYRLIKGLVDTVREFGKVHNAKIIIALRLDLIEQVFQETKGDSGFQEEKYRSLYLPLKWSKSQLVNLLNRRITELIKDQYTGYSPKFEEILPKHLGKHGGPIDYILDRTWMRPRDVIDFMNACIKRAEGKVQFTKEIVIDAEAEYSQLRLRSVIEEWHGLYPSLEHLTSSLLKRRQSQFALNEVSDSLLDEICLQIACDVGPRDPIRAIADGRVSGTLSHHLARSHFAFILYRVGAVGIKIDAHVAPRWADNESYAVSASEIGDSSRLYIHAGLWRALGIVAAV